MHLHRHCFELLGYDFMLDCELNVYLIEVNMNPCLELASPYLAELLPEVIEAVVQVRFEHTAASIWSDTLLLLFVTPFALILVVI